MALSEILPAFIGRSRIEATRLAECEKCAQVPERYILELSTWTAADDHGEAPATRAAVIAALQEVTRRIRARNHAATANFTRANEAHTPRTIR